MPLGFGRCVIVYAFLGYVCLALLFTTSSTQLVPFFLLFGVSWQVLGRRPLCRNAGCDAYATKSVDDLSDRVNIETFLR